MVLGYLFLLRLRSDKDKKKDDRRHRSGVALRRDRQVEGRMAAAANIARVSTWTTSRREAARLQRADGKAEEQLDGPAGGHYPGKDRQSS